MSFLRARLFLSALPLTLSLAGIAPVTFSRGWFVISSSSSQPDPSFAEKITLPGIRGAAEAEREQAEAPGMRVVIIPASGWSTPADEQMVQFFQLVQEQSREKIYLHCWLGNDRTGVFIAAYRIAFQHCSADDALREMNYFHFKGSWHRSMKTCIRDFPAHFASTPAFARFRPPSA